MILCFFYRHKLSMRVDSGLDPEPALQRHIERCEACRASYQQEMLVARGLTQSADLERVASPPFLQARILAAVERSTETVRPRSPLRPLAWATVLAIVLILASRAIHVPRSSPPVLGASDVSSLIGELAALENSLPDKHELAEWSGTLDKPLDTEMRSLVHDARTATHALVQNFLPDSLARLDAPEQSP
jgi:anti-sigma factor RsiW